MFSRILTVQKRESVLTSLYNLTRSMHTETSCGNFGIWLGSGYIPDIQRVIHWGLPSGVEEYVQEAGRARQNGEPAQAILYQGKGRKHSNKKKN